jgi:hypothetical protein
VVSAAAGMAVVVTGEEKGGGKGGGSGGGDGGSDGGADGGGDGGGGGGGDGLIAAAPTGKTSTLSDFPPASNRHWMRPTARSQLKCAPRISTTVAPRVGPSEGETTEIIGW